jgi:hypothetical protein
VLQLNQFADVKKARKASVKVRRGRNVVIERYAST